MISQSRENGEVGRAFRHRYEGPLYRRFFLWGVRNISPEGKRRSMPFWAGLAHTLVPAARRIAEHNLERVAGPLGPIAAYRRSFRLFVNYSQSLTDMYGMYLGQPPAIETEFFGRENLMQVLAKGEGAITLTGHFGFWQIAPLLMETKRDIPPVTLAMAEEPNSQTGEFEQNFRKRFNIVYTTRSPFATIELANILRRGELVGMQMDRHLGAPSVAVPFCGKPARFPLGPATLARAAGCPLVPFFVVASPDRRHCRFYYEKAIYVQRTRDRQADTERATAECVAVYERFVKKYPEQWFNFYDFWAA
jgi:KDO2-lipid IV(A) lauroyltransferase